MSKKSSCHNSFKSIRVDAAGAAFLVTLLGGLAVGTFAIAAPGANADKKAAVISSPAPGSSIPDANPNAKTDAKPDTKFRGRLPIADLTEDEAINHALNRLAYGPRPGEVEKIRQMGLEKWIDQQLDPNSIDDSALDAKLDKYPTITMSSEKLLEEFPPPAQAIKREDMTKEQYTQEMQQKRQDSMADMLPTGNDNFDKANRQLAGMVGPNRIIAELSMAKLDRAVYSNRQLEAVMEDFWFNHFNVFANKGADKWLVTSYVRDTIRPHTMGKFDDLLIATAKSPAMLFFLDNWQSVDPAAFAEAQRERQMRRARFGGGFGGFPRQGANGQGQQNQERGLNENYGREVMELHTLGVDAGYTQQDVIEMADCLTGWSIREPRRDPEFMFHPEVHAQGKKVVFGRTFNYGGMKDGEEALKMLAADPHTAKFISTMLARHFVSDNPPEALVDRMTKSYESSGGDIRTVLRTMIYSPEFWSKETYRAKVKTPFEMVASTVRTLDADVEVSLPLVQWVGRMGEPLFLCQPPTGYPDKSETWVNTGALLNRLNFALSFASDHMAGSKVDLSPILGEQAAGDPEMALSQALQIFLDNQVAPETRQTLDARMNDPQILQASLDDPVKQVNEGLITGLVLGTPEFQRR